jgi:hypothetical protein
MARAQLSQSNVLTSPRHTNRDFSVSFGVPFESGRIGGFVGVTSIRWTGLLANALIAFSASLILAGAIEKLFRTRIRLP